MSPIPEKLGPFPSIKDLADCCTVSAEAHNAVLVEHQAALSRNAFPEKRLEWFRRLIFGTRAEKLHPCPPSNRR